MVFSAQQAGNVPPASGDVEAGQRLVDNEPADDINTSPLTQTWGSKVAMRVTVLVITLAVGALLCCAAFIIKKEILYPKHLIASVSLLTPTVSPGTSESQNQSQLTLTANLHNTTENNTPKPSTIILGTRSKEITNFSNDIMPQITDTQRKILNERQASINFEPSEQNSDTTESQLQNKIQLKLSEDVKTAIKTTNPETSASMSKTQIETSTKFSTGFMPHKIEQESLNEGKSSAVQNPGTTEKYLQNESQLILSHDSKTSSETSPLIHKFRFEEILILSTAVTIPKNLPPNTKVILTINVTNIYNWQKEWELVNPDSVHSLILIGTFDLKSIHYFIKVFTNMETLELSDGKYLCDSVLDDYQRTPGLQLPSRLQSLKLNLIGQPCENLYKFVVDRLENYYIKEFVLKDVSIQYQNIEFIREFLNIHQKTLETLIFDNVTICGSEDCSLFDDLEFPILTEAKLYFSRGDMKSCTKSLANFNIAAKHIKTFGSNTECSRTEWKQYIRNWEKLDWDLNAGYDLCKVTKY